MRVHNDGLFVWLMLRDLLRDHIRAGVPLGLGTQMFIRESLLYLKCDDLPADFREGAHFEPEGLAGSCPGCRIFSMRAAAEEGLEHSRAPRLVRVSSW